MDEEHHLGGVMASYHRCRRTEDFVDTFYDVFLSKSPAIAEKFARTDFSRQKLMLRESLLEMLLFEQGIPGSQEMIDKLGVRHRQLQVTEEMYEMWLDSLCEAVCKHDPEFTTELETLWRRAMRKGIDAMLSVD